MKLAKKVAGFSSITLRGGRMTKWKGQVVCCAPHVGMTEIRASFSALAIGIALAGAAMLPSETQAGTCTQTGGASSGVWTCSGPIGGATTQSPTSAPGGAVTVTTSPGFGIITPVGNAISISNATSNTSVTFLDNYGSTIISERRGIYVRNNGTGALSVTSTGSVTGRGRDGIFAWNFGTDLTVSAADATGHYRGISAWNNGTGALSVTATGSVTSTAWEGIEARGSGTDLTVSAVDVTGGSHGIFADNSGTGALSVTATGSVTGRTDGIVARSFSYNGTDLTVSAADVTGGDNGISAYTRGSGALTVTATGSVTGAGSNGIDARIYRNGTDLTVSAVDVTGGGRYGIRARNGGTGALSVTATGAVTGTERNGIVATNFGTDLTVSAVDVTGGREGIRAFNAGTGAMSVTASGAVTGGAQFDGIVARNYSRGTDLTVSAVDVTGGRTGIDATNFATGALSVTSTGTVTGTNYDGIRARNFYPISTDLTVSAVNVTGLGRGIYARNLGTGITDITVNGVVTGGNGFGIDTRTGPGKLTTITLNAGAQVSSTLGLAISNDAGNSSTTVNSGAAVSGVIRLNSGSDSLNFAGGDFSGVTIADGGDDSAIADGFVDVLSFTGSSGTLVGGNFINWEEIRIGAGSTIAFSDGMLSVGDAAAAATGLFIMDGGLLDGGNLFALTGNMTVGAGSAFRATGGGAGFHSISGGLSNAGTVTFRDGVTGDRLSIGGNYTGAGGSLLLDTVLGGDGSATDHLHVGGNLTGSSLVTVSNVGGTGALTTGDGIRLVQVDGGSSGNLALNGGAIDVGAFRYSLFEGGVADPSDQDWYLRSRARDIVSPGISIARNADNVSMAFLGTLHERMGEQEHIALQGKSDEGFGGAWGRIIGRAGRENASSSAFGDSRSTSQLGALQLGFDFYRSVSEEGSSTTFGFYGGHAEARSETSLRETGGLRLAGSTRSDGYLAGLNATHRSASGWYADAVVQGSWLDNRATAVDGTTLDSDSQTILASIEWGKAFALGERQRSEVLGQGGSAMTFEPQAQIIYGNRSIDDALDSTATANLYDLENSWTGRIGMRLTQTKADDYNTEKGLFTGYLKANYWNTFSGGDIGLKMGVSDFGTVTPYKEWIDVGLGGTLSMSKNAEFFVDADVEFGIDKQAFQATTRAGIRINW